MLVRELPILQTKLYQPRPAMDVIVRVRLTDLLDRGLECPLTLVSAAAGFGKSTLVSQWVSGLGDEWKCGWYSVDESDNNLATFLLYLVSAVRSALPESCAETLELVRLEALPSPVELAASFCNDLVRLGERIIVVIDDFHRLQEPAIGDFLVALLGHPPPQIRLVIVTRRDPAISLHRWRTRGSVNEVRLDDLRFNEAEVETYLAGSLDADTPPDLSRAELQRFEGWPVALRLLVLSLRGKRTSREIAAALPSVPAKVSRYLIKGILDELDPDNLDALLKTSIPDRFNAELCAALVPDLDAPGFLQWLVTSDLFVINLDDTGGSFRYHHFFQDALRQHLSKRHDETTVREVHLRAAEWFASERFVNEAITHALKAGEAIFAGDIVAHAIRRPVVQVEREGWIDRLPDEVIRQNPALLVESAWAQINRSGPWRETIVRAEEVMIDTNLAPAEERWLRGNIASLNCHNGYRERDFAQVIKAGAEARCQLPLEYSDQRAFAYLMESLAYRSNGDGGAAQRLISEGCAEFSEDPSSLAYMLSADAHGYLMAADMPGLKSSARHFFEHCEKHRLRWVGGFSRVLAGLARYQLNDLQGAEDFLSISDAERVCMGFDDALRCRFFLGRTFAAARRWDDADHLIESLRDELRTSPNLVWSARIDALHAEIALRQGRHSSAISWVKRAAAPVQKVALVNISPAGTYVRALLAWGTGTARKEAKGLLTALVADADFVCSNESRVTFRILQALWHHGGGNDAAALDVLGEALKIAQPGGALRLFADFGTELIPLLQRLKLDVEGVEYVGRIVHAMPPPSEDGGIDAAPDQVPTLSADSHVETLSKREYEVLVLISKRLSNNEIGEKLFISAATVKRHLSNIYEKLSVHGRKEAVAKAIGLGLLKR